MMPAPKGNKYAVGNSGRAKKYTTPEELQTAIDAYYKDCNTREVPYTIEGLAYALDFIDRTSLLNYEKAKGYEEFFVTVARAKAFVLRCKMEYGIKGDYNAAILKFDLINNHGMKDKSEQDITSGGEKISPQIYLPSNGRD